MAMTGILRPGFIQLRVLDMAQAVTHYVDRLGLTETCRGEDGRVYLKTYDEFDHHSVVLREATTAGMDVFAFKVDHDASLAEFERRVRDWGIDTDEVPAGEQPGVGRRIGFTIPSGHRIELYAEIELAERRPDTHNPDIWTAEPHGMRAVRFDHALLYGPNIGEVLRFFEEALDFSCAERIDLDDGLLAIWLTVSTKPHDIAFVNHETPGKFHHAGFFLESMTDVGHAADIMVHHDINIDIGPTRHGVTRGQTIYFFDPSGNRNEVYAGGYTYYPDNPTRTWDGSEIGKVPCLDTGHGYLVESSAILEYIEECGGGTDLLPNDGQARAVVRGLCRINELYIELEARRHYPHLFFGAPKDEHAVEEAKPVMERGVAALNATAKFGPYIAGEQFGLADIVAYETFGYASAVASAIYDWDIIGAVDGLKASRDAVAARASVQQVDAALNEAMAAFQAEQAK